MKIVLDAGHALVTPGKQTPDGMKEFEFNAAVANLAKAALEQYENVQVLFTHDPTGKTDVGLTQRTDKANKWGANVFVSIHANAAGNGWSAAEGIETFAYTSKPKEAVALAGAIQKKLVQITCRKDRGVKFADFHVLRETKMTAILAECGFMTNKAEAALLRSADYRKKCATAIVEGLAEFYKLKKKPTPKPAPKQAAPAAQKQQEKPKELHRVQVGAFSDKKNAEELAAELQKKGYSVIIK